MGATVLFASFQGGSYFVRLPYILTPYPGTELFNELEKSRRILHHNWDKYNTSHAVFKSINMTAKQLEQGYVRAYKKLYTWKNLIKWQLTNPKLKSLYWGFHLGYKKFGMFTYFLSKIKLLRLFSKTLAKWVIK